MYVSRHDNSLSEPDLALLSPSANKPLENELAILFPTHSNFKTIGYDYKIAQTAIILHLCLVSLNFHVLPTIFTTTILSLLIFLGLTASWLNERQPSHADQRRQANGRLGISNTLQERTLHWLLTILLAFQNCTTLIMFFKKHIGPVTPAAIWGQVTVLNRLISPSVNLGKR
jgi:hypothetical protein